MGAVSCRAVHRHDLVPKTPTQKCSHVTFVRSVFLLFIAEVDVLFESRGLLRLYLVVLEKTRLRTYQLSIEYIHNIAREGYFCVAAAVNVHVAST